MLSALLYLQYHSIKNRTRVRLRRLKQPKYLIGGIVGGLYFYFYFFRLLLGASSRQHAATAAFPATGLALYESLAAAALFLLALLPWLLPRERAALTFTEAEVSFLFPAPISRQGLIHFKLARSQAAILFSTLILTLLGNRFGGSAWIRATGLWLVFSTLSLHTLGASFARTMLLDRGFTNLQRRAAILLALGLVAAISLAWAWKSMPGFELSHLTSLDAIQEFGERVLASGPLPWVLAPFRLMARPCLAPDGLAFLRALGPALLLLALHYYWVIRSNVAFEEASLEVSRKLAEKTAAIRSGNWRAAGAARKAKHPPFQLKPMGPPAIALLWKNLISAGQVITFRFWFVLVLVAASIALVFGSTSRGPSLASLLAMIASAFIIWSLILGPQLLRQDFRQDLPLADVLKAYPLRGWQIALGELLSPALILTAIQWALLLIAVTLYSQAPSARLQIPIAVAIALSAGILLPGLNLLTLLIPNAAVLLFPAWFQAGKENAQGIEATGQRIVFLVAQIAVYAVALLPAAVVFLLVLLVARIAIGIAPAIPLASLAAAVILAIECAIGLRLLGALFDRFDLSSETV